MERVCVLINCDKFESIKSACGYLEKIGEFKEAPIGIGVIVILGVAWFVCKMLWRLINIYLDKQKILMLEKNLLVNSFTDQDFEDAKKDYILPFCSNVDPSNYDDMRYSIPFKLPIYQILDGELNSNDGKRHILLLADSGMGKTTFLLNYLLREQKKWKNVRRMALVSLNRKDAIEQIKAIKDAKHTILLLDAFDEDSMAIDDYVSRMNELVAAAGNFKGVVMTCRTQFFAQESSIPKETGLLKVGSGRAGTTRMHEWKTVYLQPFEGDQIKEYIKKAIPFTKFGSRAKAYQIIEQIPELAVRPMLLTLIPDLIATKTEAHNLWELYEFMVHQWALREQSWIDPVKLKSLSTKLAVNLVLNRNVRNSERIPLQELVKLVSLSSESIESWKLTSRSLLNRDAGGNFKFAHRSIMEYCFIKAFIDGEESCASIRWTDMMCELFISWGFSNQQCTRLNEILTMDLRTTTLFPFVHSNEPASAINLSWVQTILDSNSFVRSSSVPPKWRPYTSQIIVKDEIVRVYDYAVGTVYQILVTASLDSTEMQLYQTDRTITNWIDEDSSMEWSLPQLSEFKALVDILAYENMIEMLDGRAVYWLVDSDSQHKSCLVRLRQLNRLPKPIELSHLTILATTESNINGISLAIDFYYGDLLRIQNSSVKGLTINTYKGAADELYHIDKRTQSRKWRMKAK